MHFGFALIALLLVRRIDGEIKSTSNEAVPFLEPETVTATFLFENDICGNQIEHFNLESDETYVFVHQRSIEDSNAISNENVSVDPPELCAVKIESCYFCHLSIVVEALDIPTCSQDGSCRCDYLKIQEPDYDKSLQVLCGLMSNTSTLGFESQTKVITMDYNSFSFNSAFKIRVKSSRNVYRLGGSSSDILNSEGLIQSPFFPNDYPSYYAAEYHIENSDLAGIVKLTFTDFQLSRWSFVEIIDTNGSRVTFNGNIFRPPIIFSSGPSLVVKFKANDESPNPGFKAQYVFLPPPSKFLLSSLRTGPITDCGGYIQDLGGTIVMSNMAADQQLLEYDCIWILRPRSSQETNLSIKVIQFEDFAPQSWLKIYDGLTSESYLLETLSSDDRLPGGSHSREYVVELATGFYLRLKGYFNNQSKLSIVYSAFRYGVCVKEYRCSNGRCIKPLLHCDGFNHCGDGSDEISCYGNAGTLSPEDVNWWRSLTPNYYFPKQEGGSSSAGTNTLILITSLAGLGMFILTTALILVKLHKQRRDNTVHREVLSTISADIDSNQSSQRGSFISLAPEPPLYDPPPSYEEVVKLQMPPTYHSITAPKILTTSIQSRINPSNVALQPLPSSGVENAAFEADPESQLPVSGNQRERATRAPKNLSVAPRTTNRILGISREDVSRLFDNPVSGSSTVFTGNVSDVFFNARSRSNSPSQFPISTGTSGLNQSGSANRSGSPKSHSKLTGLSGSNNIPGSPSPLASGTLASNPTESNNRSNSPSGFSRAMENPNDQPESNQEPGCDLQSGSNAFSDSSTDVSASNENLLPHSKSEEPLNDEISSSEQVPSPSIVRSSHRCTCRGACSCPVTESNNTSDGSLSNTNPQM